MGELAVHVALLLRWFYSLRNSLPSIIVQRRVSNGDTVLSISQADVSIRIPTGCLGNVSRIAIEQFDPSRLLTFG